MNNNIDQKFNYLLDFIKERNLEEIIKSIINNLSYLKNTNYSKFKTITDYYNKYKLWGEIDLDYNTELVEKNAKTLMNHQEDFKWFYNHLDDYKSKTVLLNILYYWLMFDDKKINKIKDNYFSQYFDLDLISCDKEEIFVDIGGYVGDSLIKYIEIFGKENYKKMYCYEMVPNNIKYIKENIKKHNLKNIVIKEKAVSDKHGKAYIKSEEVSSITTIANSGDIEVKTVKIDDDLKGKVSFIKMDIEGGELLALKGLKKKIKRYKPKLAISIYHNNDHLWQIPKLLNKFNRKYKFYLRYYGGDLVPTEYILYAV